MPLYDYCCDECGHTFEQRHGWDDRASSCPACASLAFRRLLPTFAVIGRPMGCERAGCPSRVN